MTGFLSRDIPPRATLIVVALVLLATFVTGREETPERNGSAREPTRVATATSQPPPMIVTDDLQLERLNRARKDRSMPELFVARAWDSSPAPQPSGPAEPSKPVPPPPPAAPSAPALPFRYLGHSADGARTIIYLALGEAARIAAVGETLENTYQVDEITASAVTFTYLPLGTKQTLPIPVRRQGVAP